MFYSFFNLISLVFLGLIIWGIWSFVSKKVPAFQAIGPKISPITILLSVFLTIVVIVLFNQIWSDLSRLVTSGLGADLPRYSSGTLSPTVELNMIFVHTLFVVPLVVVALMVYLSVKDKGSKYGAVTLPYFIGSLIMVLRLLWDIGDYVIDNLGRSGIYLVLIFLVVVFSALIFYVQHKWEESKAKAEVPIAQPQSSQGTKPMDTGNTK